MENVSNLDTKKANISSIKPEDIMEPNMPIDTYLQEAENLHYWALDDKNELTGAGLSWQLVAELPIRTGACREAQSLWNKEYNSSSGAAKEWKEQRDEIFEFRNDLLADFRYAFRKDEELLKQVAAIAEGSDQADLVQDLNDLAVLGKANQALLAKIHLDISKLDRAATLSNQIAGLLAKVNGSRQQASKAKTLRDQAFTYLKGAVDEINECGKYVFRKNPDRLKGYKSHYFRSR